MSNQAEIYARELPNTRKVCCSRYADIWWEESKRFWVGKPLRKILFDGSRRRRGIIIM